MDFSVSPNMVNHKEFIEKNSMSQMWFTQAKARE
jgi:hypothetical protein